MSIYASGTDIANALADSIESATDDPAVVDALLREFNRRKILGSAYDFWRVGHASVRWGDRNTQGFAAVRRSAVKEVK